MPQSSSPGALYDHFGWRLRATPVDVGEGRLTETHEYFHRQLDDTTAFGGLITTVAALADSQPNARWAQVRQRLLDMSDLVHESFAVGISLVTTQRRIEPLADYPTYDRHVRTVVRLVDAGVHPWVALAAVRAAATACMQSGALRAAVGVGLAEFDPPSLARMDRPNHRLAALLSGGFAAAVGREEARVEDEYQDEAWWRPRGAILLPVESMDGEAAEASARLQRRLLADAAAILAEAGATVVDPDDHHDDLRALLAQARDLAPEGLTRIGALVESRGGELLHGGPLDGQIIVLATAPRRAVVLPYGSLSGGSGEGDYRHVFVVVTTPRRLRAAHELEGVDLPEREAVACLRTTVFEGEERDSILLLPVETPEQIAEGAPVHVAVMSSAAAADPDLGATWMRSVDADRISLIMDTPATAALHRWLGDGARFRCSTRVLVVEGEELRIIAGRIEEPGRQSPLVVIPSTEFGARWFDAVRSEDPLLRAAVVDDPELFERESPELNVVLTHLLFEERYLGTGSWRAGD